MKAINCFWGIMIGIFFQSLVIGYSGAIMPGPLLTYTVDKSIEKGVMAGILASLGHALLELVLVIAIFLGFGSIISIPAVQIAIGLAGGIVIIFFGAGMIRDAVLKRVSLSSPGGDKARQGGILINGALISFLNPYFLIWWATIGLSLIMSAGNAFGLIGIILFYLGHILADISWYAGISAVIGKARKLLNDKIYRIVIFVLALCLIGFGINYIVSAFIKIFS